MAITFPVRRVIQSGIPPDVRRMVYFLPDSIFRSLATIYYGHDLPSDGFFRWQAKHIETLLALPNHAILRWQLRRAARRLLALSPSEAHQYAVQALLEALDSGLVGEAASIARHCSMSSDTRAGMLISDKYRFIWFRTQKVASTSIHRALLTLNPTARVIEHGSMDEFHRQYPYEAQNYFTFGFVRHPLDRLRSCWQDKIVGSMDTPKKKHLYVAPYHRMPVGTDFSLFCRWITSPWGSDSFADRHWMSQRPILTKPDGSLVDFIGKYETLDEDWRKVLEHIGLPYVDLPVINASRAPA